MDLSLTIEALLGSASRRLGHFETARLDAEVLLSAVLNKGREYLYAHSEQVPSGADVVDFNSLVDKRSRGYPVAYLIGSREFWSLEFIVNRHTLIPRPETELLVEAALDRIPVDQERDILDLGTGCGAIAAAIARERPNARVVASDISRDSLAIAMENAQRHGLSNIRFIHSDWFSQLHHRAFHVIVCNPPYVESDHPGFTENEIRYEPRLALDGGYRGLQAYHRIIPAALRRLTEKGCLLLEHGAAQGEMIRRILEENHYRGIQTIKDYSGLERISFGHAP